MFVAVALAACATLSASNTQDTVRAASLAAKGRNIPGFSTKHQQFTTPFCNIDPFSDEPAWGEGSECMNKETIEAYVAAMGASSGGISTGVVLRVNAFTLGEVSRNEFEAAIAYANSEYARLKVSFQLVNFTSLDDPALVTKWEQEPWMNSLAAGLTLPPVSGLRPEFNKVLDQFNITNDVAGLEASATAIDMISLPAPHGFLGRPGSGIMGMAINSQWKDLAGRFGPFTVMSRTIFTSRHDPSLCGSAYPQVTCPDHKILAHEMGHLLGLLHPHRRLLDCAKCSGSYAECLPSDHSSLSWLTGDFLGDTKLTPIPSTSGACLATPSLATALQCQNVMFPNSCVPLSIDSSPQLMSYWDWCQTRGSMSLFSPQQAARARCWAERHYRNLMVVPLNTPSLVVVTAISTASGVEISWTKPVGAVAGGVQATSYQISRSPVDPVMQKTLGGNTNVTVDTNVQSGQTYVYSVTPANSAGVGPTTRSTITYTTTSMTTQSTITYTTRSTITYTTTSIASQSTPTTSGAKGRSNDLRMAIGFIFGTMFYGSVGC